MMSISTQRENAILIVNVEGRIDGTTSREFHTELQTAIGSDDQAVVLNLEKLAYISSAGLRVILLISRTLQSQNSKLAVCSLPDTIKEVFTISGFDQLITNYPSQEDALTSLAT